MRKLCTAAALSAALLIPAAMRADDHRKERVVVYADPYNRDRHEWNEREERAYRHWMEQERRREYRTYNRLNKRDQREYWQWRHGHMDWHE
jgi:hypothetical protein